MMEIQDSRYEPCQYDQSWCCIYEVDPLAIHFDAVPKCADMVSRLLYGLSGKELSTVVGYYLLVFTELQ